MNAHLVKFMLLCTLLLALIASSQTPVSAQTPTPNPNICTTVTEIPQVECNELVTLYNSTNGPGWNYQWGWLTTNTPCSWFGITCETGHVTEISLIPMCWIGGGETGRTVPFSNHLNGTLPNLNLPKLKRLALDDPHNQEDECPHLPDNYLTGTIPNFNLPNLIDLSLSGNHLTGTIPNFNLPNLTQLYLYNNQLTGTIPNFNLPNLTQLYLYNNHLTGTTPNFNLPNLTQLYLYNNHLTGTTPNFNLPNLIVLSLGGNQLTGTIPNFNLPNLKRLYLSGNQLTGTIPNFNLPNLTQLSLYNNQLSGIVPHLNWSKFSNYPNDLSLSRNCNLMATDLAQAKILDGLDPDWQTRNPNCPFLANPPRFTFVMLSGDTNPLPSTVTINHSGVSALTWTSIISNAPWLSLDTMQGTTPSTVTISVNGTNLNAGDYYGQINFHSPAGLQTVQVFLAVVSCTGVTEIPQTECQELVTFYNSTNGASWTKKMGWLNTNTPCSWYGITCEGGHIDVIHLYENSLNGTLPNLNLPNLTELFLGSNQLTGTIPDFNLPNLTRLYLYDNQLTGTIPNFNLPNLTEFALGGNQLTGTIPNFNLPKLTGFGLGSNHLTGTIPNFNLPKLTGFGLSGNQLTGTIPDFDLPNLKGLYLDNNQLTGTIPDFSHLPNLTELSLGSNHLTGTIPNFNLPNLTELTLDNNQLSGVVPHLNWSNFSNYSNDLSLAWNCNLIATDLAQAKILDDLDPDWQTRNPDCPFLVNPPRLIFDTYQGDSNPLSKTVIIGYNNTAALTWTTSISNAPWLSLDTMQDTTSRTVTILVNGAGLSAGDYYGQIDFQSPLGMQTVEVFLAVFSCNAVTEIPQTECQELVTFYNSTNGASWSDTGWADRQWLTTNRPCDWYGISCEDGHVTGIYINRNNLNGILPNLNLPNLTIFSLEDNQLTGVIPNFSHLPSLTKLDLWDNHLTGTIPDFSHLPNLTELDLGRNQLTGTIPDFNLNLTELDLSENQLSGVVPDLNWSSFSDYLSLSQNCDLIATDLAQAKELDIKDSNWQKRNPKCPFLANPPRLTLFMVPGINNPFSKTITINYNSAVPITWTAIISNMPWLSLDVMQSTAPSTITVTITPTGVLTENSSGEIIFTAEDEAHSSQTITVYLIQGTNVYLPITIK